jgi:hypothetical protein
VEAFHGALYVSRLHVVDKAFDKLPNMATRNRVLQVQAEQYLKHPVTCFQYVFHFVYGPLEDEERLGTRDENGPGLTMTSKSSEIFLLLYKRRRVYDQP